MISHTYQLLCHELIEANPFGWRHGGERLDFRGLDPTPVIVLVSTFGMGKTPGDFGIGQQTQTVSDGHGAIRSDESKP